MNKNYFFLGFSREAEPNWWLKNAKSPPRFNLFRVGIFALLMLLSFVQTSRAQSSANYSFETNSSGSLIDMSSGTTTAVAAGLDATNTVTPKNIGFDFYFMGNLFTQFSLQEDGIVQLGSSVATTNTYTLTGGTATSPRLGAFVADFRTGATTGKIHYKVTGTAPNRVLTVEFLNMQLFYTGTAMTGTSTWQMRLFENGTIEYIYGPMNVVDIASGNKAPSIGFYTGSGSGNFVAVNYTAHTTSTTTYAANPNIAAVGDIVALNSASDGNRRVYKFTPQSGNPLAPITFSANPVAQSTMTINWVDNSTNETFFTVGRSTSASGPFTSVGIVNSTTTTDTGGSYQLAQTGLVANTTYYYEIVAKNEGGGISPALAASQITAPPGNVISAQTGNWSDGATWVGGVAPSIYDNATIVTGHTVSINATNQAISNLTVNGTLGYTSTPTSFAVNGSLIVGNTGAVNVFSGTTGKTLTVAGNITNNGIIDVSVGTGAAGTLTLNGTTVQTVTIAGAGEFNTNVIRNLIFNNNSTETPNIIWSVDNIKIANNLNLTNARITLGNNKMTFGNNAAAGTLTAPNGSGFLSGSKFSRWWTAGATGSAVTYGTTGATTDITTTTSKYPFVANNGSNRSMWITRSSSVATGNTAGELEAVYTDATTTTKNLNIADGAYTISERYDGNWAVTPSSGYAYTSGTHAVALMGSNTIVTQTFNTRVMTAASVVGTHKNSNLTPTGFRSEMTLAQLTAAPFYLGIASEDVIYVSIANGNWNAASTWNKGIAPSCGDTVIIAGGTNVTVNSASEVAKNITIATGASLTVASGDLTMGCTLNNNSLVNNGTLTVSGGILNINGNLMNNTGSTFNQSGGEIIVDGNDGVVANSVATGTAMIQVTASTVANLNLTGGKITIVNPHRGTSTSDYALRISQGGAANSATPNHTIQFGDGNSTIAGGHTNGFYFYLYQGVYTYALGNIIVDTEEGTNRFVKSISTVGLTGGLNIISGEYQLASTTILGGNVLNNGTLTATSLLAMGEYVAPSSINPSVNAQSISGTGVFRNSLTTTTATLTNFQVSNSNATGVTLNVPLSVSGTLTINSGIINTTESSVLHLGTDTATGTLSVATPSATTMVKGPFSRTILSGNTAFIPFPVGTTAYSPIAVNPATTAVTKFKVTAFNSNTGTANAAITNLSSTRRWEANKVSGEFTTIKVGLGDALIASTNIPVQAPTASGVYTSAFGSTATYTAGTPNTIESNEAITSANYTGFLSFADSNACSGTPAPGNTIASDTSICLGQSVMLSLQNTVVGTGVTYQWKSSTDGVVYTNITDATASTLDDVPLVATYYKCEVTCATGPAMGASTPVHILFGNSITDVDDASRCGFGSVTLTATGAGDPSAIINWYDSATGGNLVGTGSPFATPSINTTTTFYVGNEVMTPAQATLGSGSGTSSTAPAPFNAGYGSLKGQYIFTAAELQAAGLSVGIINKLGLEFTIVGGPFKKFELSIGHTNLSSFPTGGNIQGGLTTVYTNPSFAPTVGVNNFDFGTGTGLSSFTWNGTSNIIVSICWNISDTATSGTSATVKTDVVSSGLNVSQSYRKDTEANPCAFTGSVGSGTNNFTLSSTRPMMIFSGQAVCSSPRVPVVATVTSAPAFALSSNSATICAGEPTSAVTIETGATDYNIYSWEPSEGVSGNATTGWIFTPSTNTTYQLIASQSAGVCSAEATVVITVNPLPASVVFANPNPSLCAGGAAVSLGSGEVTPITITCLEDENGQWPSSTYTPVTCNGVAVNNITTAAYAGEYSKVNVTANTKYTFASTGAGDNVVISNESGTEVLAGGPSPIQWVSSNNAVIRVYSQVADCIEVDVIRSRTVICEPLNLYTWSPQEGLFTDAAATVPYTGANTASVYAKPSTTTVYTATATTAQLCSTSSSLTVTVNELPTVTTINQVILCNGGTVDLTAANVTTGSTVGLTFTYFTNATATTPVSNPTAVGVGTYYIKGTTPSGCSAISSVVVTQPELLAATITDLTHVACNGATNGSATVVVTGGTTPYTYLWSNNTTSATLSGVAIGTYTVVVTDANGCTTDAAVTITQPELLVATIADPTHVTCNGATNGSATVTVTGGATPYTYLWNNTTTSATLSGIAAGTYNVIVTDANGCTANTSVTIIAPALLVATITNPTQVSCNGGNNGAAMVTVNGGTAPYTYLWNTNATTAEITGVVAGTYNVVVTDANGCTANASVTITEGASINLVITNPVASCGGTVDITAPAVVAGSDTGLIYSYWADPSGQVTFPSPNAIPTSGTYFIKATNGAGCFKIMPVVVTVNNTAAPTGTAIQDFTGGQTLADFTVVGQNIIWYSSETGTTVLPSTTVLVSGTIYYASQTVNGCESTARLAVTAGNDLKTPEFNLNQLRVYPNPVQDILTIDYSETIQGVQVFNMLGQMVYNRNTNASQVKIDMSAMATGTYIVQMTVNGITKNVKVIKK